MDQIDAFPEHISTTVMPVTLPEKPDALEYAARLDTSIMSSDYKELETISKARYDEKSTCNGNKLSDSFVQRDNQTFKIPSRRAAKRGNHCKVASLDGGYEKKHRRDSVNEPALLYF
ncbi:hypothetical protein TNCV_1392351 [Trichonephila clavipes]|nr:hypothetical protein TNCV_1392351 [Trichonephila clavipes]